jgi:hypothetical protein
MLMEEGILTRGLDYSLRLPIPVMVGNSGYVQISLSKEACDLWHLRFGDFTLFYGIGISEGKDFRSQLRGSNGLTPFSLH